MEWLWIAMAIGFIVVELSTMRLVSVWFAVSSLMVSLIRLIFPALGLKWQAAIFAGLSILLFVITRPLVKRILAKDKMDNEKTE